MFLEESFQQDLKNGLSMASVLSHFNSEFKETADHYRPIKITKLCGNTKTHITKLCVNTKTHINMTFRKEIMKKSRLKNKANKTGLVEDLEFDKIERNIATKLS